MNPNLAAALRLAGLGIPVFPAIAAWNEKDRKLAKRPAIAGWQTAASTERAYIEEWWRAFPDAVPGIELGRAGLVVIDLDRHPGGADGVAAFKTLLTGRELPPCPTTRTASGGFHLFFKQPEGRPLGNGTGALPRGIDIRGARGWVVAPGAVHERGAWRALPNRPALNAAPISPDWLLAIIRPPPKPRPIFKPTGNLGRLRGLVCKVLNASAGERNTTLYWAACRAKEMGGGSTFAAAMLEEAATRAGLPVLEARRT